VLDREGRRHLDVFFDRPLGRELVGHTPAEPPAELRPRTGGVWRWQGDNILRFAATDRLEAATRYEIELIPERLLGEKQIWAGELRFEVVTDAFQVERVDLHEEPLPDEPGKVRLRGTLYFNYPVEPRELAPRLELRDPGATEPVPVALETRWNSKSIGFRVEAITKSVEERTLELIVAGDLTPAEGNVELAESFVHSIVLGSRNHLAVRSVTSQPGEQESVLRIELSSPAEPEAARGSKTAGQKPKTKNKNQKPGTFTAFRPWEVR